MITRHLTALTIAAALSFSGCNCHDAVESGWTIEENFEFPEDADADVSIDVGPPDVTVDAWQPDVVDAEDADADADADVEPVDPWQPEEVEPAVPSSHALTDRTGLAVDADGTLWLGYHACNDLECSSPKLRVVHRPLGGEWRGENVGEHDGIFGVSVVVPGEPIVVFPDSNHPTYKAAHRQPDGNWRVRTFPVQRRSRASGDGFDVTQDGTSYFVSFAPEGAEEVEFYRYDTSTARPNWRPRTSLSVDDPQAAMERGLRADPGEGVYLVNYDGASGVYGVYRYDEDLDAWPQSVALDEYTSAFVHSLYITSSFELCMSSNYSGRLLVTCGSMFDLTQENHLFSQQRLARHHPSSIIEGDDGTLYVAYNPDGNDELRVARRAPNTNRWRVETVFDGPSYGVSTAIAQSGDLVISFYTCDDDDRCSLQVLWETPQ